jgi:hypothetical protein
LVLDATWNHRQWCLLLYRDTGGLILTHRFDLGERFEGYLEDLTRLKSAGYQPTAIVSDGKRSLLKAVNRVFPGVPQQRCLLHLQRQCLVWLTQRPKTLAGQSLRYLATQLLQVQSIEEAQDWNLLFDSWFKLFQEVLQEKTFAAQPPPGKRSWGTPTSLYVRLGGYSRTLNPTFGCAWLNQRSPRPPICLRAASTPLSNAFYTATPVYVPTVKYSLSLGGYFSEITPDYILICPLTLIF